MPRGALQFIDLMTFLLYRLLMIEFGRISEIEPPFPVYRTPTYIRRLGNPLADPQIGTVTVFGEDGSESAEKIGIRVEDGRLAHVDDENEIEFLDGELSEILIGANLVPRRLELGLEVAFQRQTGFREALRPLGMPMRHIEFAHKAGRWTVASIYREVLKLQEHGPSIPYLEDDRD
jgi:hypothetical protein